MQAGYQVPASTITQKALASISFAFSFNPQQCLKIAALLWLIN
jgi:hypothetical protein